MLKNIVSKVCQRYNTGKPRVVVGVPSGITEVEERAVEESVLRAGAKEVFLIEEPMAAAIGANLEVAEPSGNIIVDIGGGNEGLLHISKISSKRVEKVEDVLSVGDEVTVKVSEIDNQGRINLNMKDLEAGNNEEKE